MAAYDYNVTLPTASHNVIKAVLPLAATDVNGFVINNGALANTVGKPELAKIPAPAPGGHPALCGRRRDQSRGHAVF